MFPYPNGKSYLDFKDEAKNKLESFIPLCAFLFGVSGWVGLGGEKDTNMWVSVIMNF